jgi:hypothetical protein
MLAVAAAREAGQLLLEPDQAAKLLVLMGHARSCPGHHTSTAHAEVRVLYFLKYVISYVFHLLHKQLNA